MHHIWELIELIFTDYISCKKELIVCYLEIFMKMQKANVHPDKKYIEGYENSPW